MANCNFTIDINGDAEKLVEGLRSKVIAQGGTFNGNTQSGSIDVPVFGSRIKGTYNITGQQADIEITDKPFLIGCGQIKSYLMGNL